jgi:outer membrane protein OmpA-like peptidoglycan-associated protein
MVVLMPDQDGRVGSAEVFNESGRQILNEAGQSTVVTGRQSPPSQVRVMDDQQVEKVFAGALAGEPSSPEKFTLYFRSGSTDLTLKSVAKVPVIVESILKRNSYDIGINGHTDRVASKAFNMKLSFERAQRVKELLVKAGIRARYISTASHGEGNPLIPTRDGVAEPRNRRVEVIVR